MPKLAENWGDATYSEKSTRTAIVEAAYQRNKNAVCVIEKSRGLTPELSGVPEARPLERIVRLDGATRCELPKAPMLLIL